MVQAIKINQFDEGDDPFGLFGEAPQRRTNSSKRRQFYANDGAKTDQMPELHGSGKKRANSGRGPRETFHVIEARHSENRINVYEGQNAQLQDEERKRSARD